ncbi:MAG: 2-hydroxy-acid oxidase [Candidatus Pelagibacter sp.]|nr:2-hydroxy-acid oxidase [Candidatus Pelagibacter sp.]OUT95757.1 MAG: 2-hydroxy-acid oxidase [Gammaproteobacteria bacterium TMED36]|tara:strand:+ start:1165 stop:2445 length:1281 start_codon:yes stop_codon:yes gene_type:complete
MEEKQNFQTFQGSNSNVIKPQNELEVSAIIKECYDSGISIELYGKGSKRNIGKPTETERALDFSEFVGVNEYLPEELYISVKPGTPISLIEEELKKNNQCLAFEPIDFGYLFLGKSNYGTAAGHVACNITGPRRLSAGSIRDHVLGFRGVNGRGEIIKSGGKVVKNVTGYDLSKIICGSYGTLVALTEVTFKVLPSFELNKTLVIHGLNVEQASELFEKSLSSPNNISGASFLPIDLKCEGCTMNIEKTFQLNDLKHGGSITALRIEGVKNSVEERINNLFKDLMISSFETSTLDDLQSKIFWNKIKNLEMFLSNKNNILRAVVPPSKCVLFSYLLNKLQCKYFIDWAGSLFWIEVHDLSEEMFDNLRKKVIKLEGYISMIKSSENLPSVEEVFTINIDKFNISQNIKKSFDPKRILNPGKMYTGI